MTTREPWPLLAALDEFLAEPEWRTQEALITIFEENISRECYIGHDNNWALCLHGGSTSVDHRLFWPPFLRSRDAAAMLEEAVYAAMGDRSDLTTVTLNGRDAVVQILWRDPPHSTAPQDAINYNVSEPAARTGAALEAGWQVGLWPVRTKK